MFKPNSPGCGCYLTASRYAFSPCLIKLQWCTQGDSPILDLGAGPSGPIAVAKSGFLITLNKGPFTLTSTGCKGTISCAKAAITRCPCLVPVPGSGAGYDAAGYRQVVTTSSANPSNATCTASFVSGSTSGSSVGYLSQHIATSRFEIDYAINDECQGEPSSFETFIGTVTDNKSFSGTTTIAGIVTAFGGSRVYTYDLYFGFSSPFFYFRTDNLVLVSQTGTDARSAGFNPLNYSLFDSGTSVSCSPGGYGVGAGSAFFFFDAYDPVMANPTGQNPPVWQTFRECIPC